MTAVSLISDGGDELAPVVLVHGFGADAVATWQSTGWTGALDADGRRWLAVDLLGHGTAAKPHDASAYEPDALAAGIVRLLDDRELEEVDLVGYSLGGELALRIADANAGRVRRLVVGGVGKRRPFGSALTAQVRRHLAAGEPITDPVALAIWNGAAAFPGSDPRALAALAQALGEAQPVVEHLGYSGPALLFRGAHDPLSAGMADLARRLAQAVYLEIPKRNHVTTLSARAVKADALAFLRGIDPPVGLAARFADFIHVTPDADIVHERDRQP